MHFREVELQSKSIAMYFPIIGDKLKSIVDAAASTAKRMRGRTIWNINSTSIGGGVAELLQALLPYCIGLGVPTRWLVFNGNSELFKVSKRLYHAMYGHRGNGTPIDQSARDTYEKAFVDASSELSDIIKPGDIVILHDLQVAGFAHLLACHGAIVIWRCHLGTDERNEHTDAAWTFLEPYLQPAAATIFLRKEFIPTHIDIPSPFVVTPSIDPFSAKNRYLDPDRVNSILARAGILGDASHETRIRDIEMVLREGPAPPIGTPLVIQVSRWDRMKDPVGTVRSFSRMVEANDTNAHFLFAGPELSAIADDPEDAEVKEETLSAWHKLPRDIRKRISIASLPMSGPIENALLVNALQRNAHVVIQKSIAEGFGLSVTEAMWKEKPVVASAVGGINDQIVSSRDGILIKDPHDLDAFSKSVCDLLLNSTMAKSIGLSAKRRVTDEFLSIDHLIKYSRLLSIVDEGL